MYRYPSIAAVFAAVLVVSAARCVLLGAPVAVAEESAPAQESMVARIGVLFGGSSPDPFVDAFRQGLQDAGYVEGRNVRIEYRWADGMSERLPSLAAELVRLRVDVIVAASQAALAAKTATSVIPIVMPIITDPVRLGLVASLGRPGGNVTGFATQNDELPGKWLDILRDAFPGVSRVALLWSPIYDRGAQLRTSEAAARSIGVRLQPLKVEQLAELEAAFSEMQKSRPQALIVSSSPVFYRYRARLVAFAAKQRLPTMYHQSEFVIGSGGLMSYGPDFHDLFRRSATYVDKILKGAKPGDLPVQQPIRFEFVVNRKTANALGVSLPDSMLLRADRIID